MARYCIAFDTMNLFTKVTGTETLSDLVGLLRGNSKYLDVEYKAIALRQKWLCLDGVAVKEQRVQWHSVESEWEEALKYFEQGQEQTYHQVGYYIMNCFVI